MIKILQAICTQGDYMAEILNKIDPEAVRSRATNVVPYPNIRLLELNKCVPLIVSTLETGDVALIGTLNGVTKILCKISLTLGNITKLLAVSKIMIQYDEEREKVIENPKDYLEVMYNWIC